MAEGYKVPTEFIDLPSKGIPYPKDSALASGQIELKYLTAKEEDILTNINYIKAGTVLDKLFKSIIVSKIEYDELLLGDKDMIMIAARILGDGKDYTFEYTPEDSEGPIKITKDLSTIESKPISDVLQAHQMEYSFILPYCKLPVKFKLLTHRDEKLIDDEIRGIKKVQNEDHSVSIRLKHTIVEVNGNRDRGFIKDFVENGLTVKDAKPLRAFISEITPGIKFTFDYTKQNGEVVGGLSMPLTADFFWSQA
jgi:hypothetical protein